MPALEGRSAIGAAIGRAGHVDDIAAACLYLAADGARYVTGATRAADGGWTAS